jgi:uncharacterized membrane protein YphA (DoxX/SURF4 family)
MFAITIVVAVALALAFVAAGASKVARAPRTVDMADHLGVPRDRYRLIGVAELFGATGVLIGLKFVPVGIAAAVGLVALMIGAAAIHSRAKDGPKEIAPAVGLAVIGLAYAVLRAVTS